MPKTNWVYVLTGGQEFSIEMPCHPMLLHDGSFSIWNVYLNKSEQIELEAVLNKHKQPFKKHNNLPTKEENLHKEEFYNKEKIFHSSQCVRCWWFDLTSENRCGVMDLQSEVVAGILKNEESLGAKDFSKCPVIKEKK